MHILPIQSYQNNTFKSKKGIVDYVTKKLIEPRKITNELAKDNATKMEKYILASGGSIVGIDLLLKEKGITYCESKGNIINIGDSKNGDFYQIKTNTELQTPIAQEFIFRSLKEEPLLLGGLINYKNMINDIGRQDIIRKGLKLHTYELNNSLPENDRKLAAKHLIKKTNIALTPNNLFYLGSDVFFYDKTTKTAYGTTIINKTESKTAKPKFITCTFITNDKGKAIGYKVNEWDYYFRNYVDKEYIEQQEPSYKLPQIITIGENNKEVAEAFRFGNSDIDEKFQIKMPFVLEHIHTKAGISSVFQKDLQLIKYYNKNRDIERKFAYFNPTTGRSLVYNQDGKYLYQLEYIKDHLGNITSCTKF